MVSWLTDLSCPVINRPSPTCLSGPSWRQLKWVQLAAEVGVEVTRRLWQTPHDKAHCRRSAPPQTIELTVVAGRCIDATDGSTAAAAERLAKAAGVSLVGLRFATDDSTPRFLGANLWPPLDNELVIDAVLHHLLAPRDLDA